MNQTLLERYTFADIGIARILIMLAYVLFTAACISEITTKRCLGERLLFCAWFFILLVVAFSSIVYLGPCLCNRPYIDHILDAHDAVFRSLSAGVAATTLFLICKAVRSTEDERRHAIAWGVMALLFLIAVQLVSAWTRTEGFRPKARKTENIEPAGGA